MIHFVKERPVVSPYPAEPALSLPKGTFTLQETPSSLGAPTGRGSPAWRLRETTSASQPTPKRVKPLKKSAD